MFSNEARCRYGQPQLAEVICQLRFPEILSIQANLPAAFQDAIRDQFPVYLRRQELALPSVANLSGNLTLQKKEPVLNHQFATPDGVWRVNLTSKFISLTCSRYSCWEAFAAHLDKPLAAFIQTYQPAYFERVGLRYLNFISRVQLGLEGVPFSRLIAPCYLGLLAEEDVAEHSVSRSTVDCELPIQNGCRIKLHAGPGKVKRGNKEDPEVKFIFDQDLFQNGPVQVNRIPGTLQSLHTQAFSVFRGAITEKLHAAMEPEDI